MTNTVNQPWPLDLDAQEQAAHLAELEAALAPARPRRPKLRVINGHTERPAA